MEILNDELEIRHDELVMACCVLLIWLMLHLLHDASCWILIGSQYSIILHYITSHVM